MSSIELSNGSATLTARADYLLVVEHGTLSTADEVARYTSELETAANRFQLRRLLVDARSETTESAARGEARTGMWRWIRAQRSFEMIGFVLVDQMMIARVNMTALSEKLPIRAFDSVAEGHRWLARIRRPSTTMPAMAASSSIPPRSPTPDQPATRSASDSSTRNARPRFGTTGTQEGDAFSPAADQPTLRSTGEHARTTVKIAAVDPATADRKLGRT
jgi:hypothetical protein